MIQLILIPGEISDIESITFTNALMLKFLPLKIVGSMARGIAALGSSFIAVGLHTGEVSPPIFSLLLLGGILSESNCQNAKIFQILLFNIQSDGSNSLCSVVGQHRSHIQPISDMASSATQCGKVCGKMW